MNTGMNPQLAARYNTHGYGDVVNQEMRKQAHLELFAKSAAANGIDLSAMTPEARTELYSAFTKQAGENPFEENKEEGEHRDGEGETHEEKKEEEKKEEEKEEEEKKEAQAQAYAMAEWQQKVAEADYLGRTMAHALHDEQQKIKLAEASAVSGKQVPVVVPTAKTAAVNQAASALDVQAAKYALKLAQAANMDVNDAANRLNALLTLGVPPMDKTASAATKGNYDHTLNVRALELMESAGYPIDWSQVPA
jgi:hypothetical protein